MPAISVLMPVYNAGRFLAPAIESILHQTFTDFELVIVNDGSSDGSGEIIDAFAAQDDRIVCSHQSNQGLVSALNRLLRLARAPLIARLDGDDISLPDRLQLQFDTLQADQNLTVVGGHVQIIDQDGAFLFSSFAPVGQRKIAKDIMLHSPLTHSAVMMRKKAIMDVGGYRPAYESAEDYDLWLRLFDAGYVIDNLNCFVVRYRQHGASLSAARHAQQALRALLARVASRMRHSGLDDAVLERAVIDEQMLRRLPLPFRPSEPWILEAVHGPAASASPQRLHLHLARIDDNDIDAEHRQETATFVLRCALGLIKHRHLSAGFVALIRAIRMDYLVVVRQLRLSTDKLLVRFSRRAQFVAKLSFLPNKNKSPVTAENNLS